MLLKKICFARFCGRFSSIFAISLAWHAIRFYTNGVNAQLVILMLSQIVYDLLMIYINVHLKLQNDIWSCFSSVIAPICIYGAYRVFVISFCNNLTVSFVSTANIIFNF